jgi:LmbE family N-acetylglucosaminyl deacetylase
VRKCLLFSPHADDAVLSCGQFIGGRPDTVVVTVFMGYPPEDVTLTSYDRSTGFSTSQDAVSVRRAEDTEALAYLKATAIHLEHLDSQYGDQDRASIVADINRLIDEIDPELVLAPLGLKHPDHIEVRSAVLEAMGGRETPLWLYEDLPARVLWPECVTEALDALHLFGYSTELGFVGTGSMADKCSALWAYKSQMILPEFENRHAMLVPERFWKVAKAATPEQQA